MTGEGPSDKAGADLILLNGNVIPVALPNKREQALAISRGKIIAVGPNWAIEQLRGRRQRWWISRAHRLPGFIDSHVHFFLTAASYQALNSTRPESIDEACRLVGEQAAKIPPMNGSTGSTAPLGRSDVSQRMDELDPSPAITRLRRVRQLPLWRGKLQGHCALWPAGATAGSREGP